jgi:drug/metabolite transporter (DMT)-like permease
MADPIIIPRSDAHIKQADRPMLGLFLRLAAMAVLGIMFVFVKLAGDHGVHVAESIFWRQLAGLPAVVAWLWWTGNLSAIRTRNPLGHGLRMILGVGAMIFNFLAMILLPMAEATTIGFAAPIFATILAALLLGEPTGRYRWGAILLGFAGVLIAVRPGVGVFNITSTTIALCGALLTGCVAIQLRRLSQTESTGAIVFWFSLCSMIPLGIAMLFFAHSHDSATWMFIAGLASAGAVAQILLTAALRHAPVAAILTMDYSGLIWSLLFGWLFFADIPSHSVWIGAPIIIAAGLVIAWREHYLRHKAIVTD